LIVIRDAPGTETVCGGTDTATPASVAAWNVSVAVPPLLPGFWRVRNSTKPGRTVPSANRNVVAPPGGFVVVVVVPAVELVLDELDELDELDVLDVVLLVDEGGGLVVVVVVVGGGVTVVTAVALLLAVLGSG
jgi:hypothetical protein